MRAEGEDMMLQYLNEFLMQHLLNQNQIMRANRAGWRRVADHWYQEYRTAQEEAQAERRAKFYWQRKFEQLEKIMIAKAWASEKALIELQDRLRDTPYASLISEESAA